MERAKEHLLTPIEQSSHAWAFDRQRLNRRPAFLMHQTLLSQAGGSWVSRREWRAVGPDLIAHETVVWRGGLLESTCEQPPLDEVTRAVALPTGCLCTLRSSKTAGKIRDSSLVLRHPPVTLASLPLFIAQHWAELVGGTPKSASYLVLKVQRAATVQVQRVTSESQAEIVIATTPANPLLRWIFGSTLCVFDADAPRLRRVHGLLDPRDLKRNGRWQEYLGTVEFDHALDLSQVANQRMAR